MSNHQDIAIAIDDLANTVRDGFQDMSISFHRLSDELERLNHSIKIIKDNLESSKLDIIYPNK